MAWSPTLETLAEIADERCNIAYYEWPGFLNCFCNYVNRVDCDDMTHTEAIRDMGAVSSRYADACHEMYQVILENPELWW